ERPDGAGAWHHRAGVHLPRGLRRLLLRQLEGAVVPLEDWMRPGVRGNAAVAALVLIALVTASWWALALWPIDGASEWIVRTREVCFGATRDGLPNAGGWILLIGQPTGMVALLAVVWPADLRAGLARVLSRLPRQLAAGAAAAAIIAGLGGVVVRVSGAGSEFFPADVDRERAAGLTRVDDAPPAMTLVDQRGQSVTLGAFGGRPVLVTFAF